MRRDLVLVLVVVLGLVSCADPFVPSRPSTAPARSEAVGPTAPKSATGDARPPAAPPVPVVPRRDVRAGAASPRALVRTYVELAVNWDWRTLAGNLRRLLRLADGRLAADLARAVDATRADASLERDRPSSRGELVGLDVQGHGTSRRLVVVTAETEAIAGRGSLEGTRHRVYLARAQRTEHGWRMTAWEREP